MKRVNILDLYTYIPNIPRFKCIFNCQTSRHLITIF